MSLCIQQLRVQRGSRVILDGVDLQLEARGQVIALIGANGAGKSTLIQALAGFLPASGAVNFNDIALNALSLRERSRHIALMPQSLPQQMRLSVYEFLLGSLLAAGLRRVDAEARIEDILARLDLRALALQSMATLSGGQRQMIALAQALARQAALLLLDEPTSALDLRWQLAVLDAVRAEVKQRQSTAILALHDLNLALRYCDQIVVLANAKIVAQGAPTAVLTPELLREVYGIHSRIEYCSQGSPMLLVKPIQSAIYRVNSDVSA